MRSRAINVLMLAFALAMLLTGRAHAYLDPGTGSIVLQGLIGAAVGGLFVVKMQWARIKGWLSSKQDTDSGETAE
jgi:hypothetical protein